MDQTTSVEKLLRLVDRNALRRLLRSQNDDEGEGSDEEDARTSPQWPHQQAQVHSPQQIPADRSSDLDANEWSGGEEQLQASSGQCEVYIGVEAQDDIDCTCRDLLPDVGSTMTDTTTTDDEEKDLGRDIPSQKGMGDLQSLPLPADEVGEGKTNVQTSKREQEDSSDAEGCKQLDPPLSLSPEPSSDTGHAFSTSGDDQGVRTDRSLATDRMEAGQEAEASEDLEVSATVQVDPADMSTAPTEEWNFYKGRPSFAARVDSLPSSDQEHNIIKQLQGIMNMSTVMIIVGNEGCGKTTAALMLARHMTALGETQSTYWYDSDHVSRCWFPRTGTSSLLVVDDFLGHCPSESLMRWRSLHRFLSVMFATAAKDMDMVLTSRTSVLQQFQASSGAELTSLFCDSKFVTVSMDYKQMWKSTTTGIKLKPPDFDRLPSVGFPLCCKLLPYVSQSVQKILFEQPRCALRKAVFEVMNGTSVARTALALLAVTDNYLDTGVLRNPAQLQASQYWKLLNSLEKQSSDRSTVTAVMSFYETCRSLILLEDEFASFVNEAVRESVLVVLCESHGEFLSEFCSLKLLSQIALVTSDVTDDSDRDEKPVLPDCAKSAFLRRMITEVESRNYHGVFTCSLLRHASFRETLAEKINQDLMTTLLDTRDQNGLHFLFYAGAIDSVFEHVLDLVREDKRMVVQALVACCFWNHADEIAGLWSKLKDRTDLKKSLKTATIEQILTGDLPGFSREEAPQWMEVPVNPKDTLVTMAAWRGKNTVVKNLASRGMNINSQGKNGWTALMHYCARGNSHMTNFLLQKKADPLIGDITGMTALVYALSKREWAIPRELISMENCQMFTEGKESPLMYACANGWSVHMITNILSHGARLNDESLYGCTCLHYACMCGNTKVTEYLLMRKKMDAEQETRTGLSPFLLALTRTDRSELIKLLLKNKATKTSPVALVLRFTCMYSGTEILEQVLSFYDADYPMKLLALEEACAVGNADIVRYLLQMGVNPESPVVHTSLTCLHRACEGVSLETVEMLATHIHCNVKTASGTTPIMIALQHGRLEYAQLLHRRGASLNLNDDIGGCLHHAALSDSVLVLEWCVKEQKMDVNDRNGNNQTPLFLASTVGRTRSMKWLLDHGADVTATDKDGNSCLHAAAQSGCLLALEIVGSKISYGDLNVPNHSGKTPLQLAQESGHTHVVDFLTNSD